MSTATITITATGEVDPLHPEQQHEQQNQQEQSANATKPPKKPRLRTKLAEAKDYGVALNSSTDEDLSELVLIKTETPTSNSTTSDSSNFTAPISFNNTKVYYSCQTCGRLVTSMGNRKHKLRLHLRSKYHRLRAKATAEALDTDLVRIVANLRANNIHCLELREKGKLGGENKDENSTSSGFKILQLYCNFCEAELVTRKSSNIRRHLESRAHKRSAQLQADYKPLDSTTFHFELVQWLVDCDLSVDRLTTMRPFLERHFRRRILEPATLKRDFLPYVLAASNVDAQQQGGQKLELPKGPMKKRAVLWLQEKRNEEKKMRVAQESTEEASDRKKKKTKPKGSVKRLKRIATEESLHLTSTIIKAGNDGENAVEDSNAVMAILEEGVDYEVVHLEQVSDGLQRAIIQERQVVIQEPLNAEDIITSEEVKPILTLQREGEPLLPPPPSPSVLKPKYRLALASAVTKKAG